MPERTVCIEVYEDGRVMVGLEPPGEQGAEEAAERPYMSEAKDVGAALQVARDLLTGDTAVQAESVTEAPTEEDDMAAGFAGARPMGPRGG